MCFVVWFVFLLYHVLETVSSSAPSMAARAAAIQWRCSTTCLFYRLLFYIWFTTSHNYPQGHNTKGSTSAARANARGWRLYITRKNAAVHYVSRKNANWEIFDHAPSVFVHNLVDFSFHRFVSPSHASKYKFGLTKWSTSVSGVLFMFYIPSPLWFWIHDFYITFSSRFPPLASSFWVWERLVLRFTSC